MDQYTRVFGTVRIPGVQMDELITYPFEKSTHAVVLVREHFFRLDLFDSNLNPRNAKDILFDLEDILARANNMPIAPSVSAFTYNDRTVWALARQQLLDYSATNRYTMETIQSALTVMVFDENRPDSNDEIARLSLNGEGTLRFFDKSSQSIHFANGYVGNNAEHTPYDAPPAAHGNMSFIHAHESAQQYIELSLHRRWDYAVSQDASLSGSSWSYLPIRLPPGFQHQIDAAVAYGKSLAASSEIRVLEYERYGMEFIRRVAKQSPDSWIQMALQLTFYRLYGYCVPTYETQQTRGFLHGRTETGRVLSVDSVAWVKTMEEPNKTPVEKFEALKKAIITHALYMVDAAAGKGIDRHFLGLRLLLRPGEEPPKLFKDKGFWASQHWILSTSNMTPGVWWEGGFGAYLQEGIGCCYGLRPHGIWVCIATRTSNPQTNSVIFRDSLRQVLDDMNSMTRAALAQNPNVTDAPNIKKQAKL